MDGRHALNSTQSVDRRRRRQRLLGLERGSDPSGRGRLDKRGSEVVVLLLLALSLEQGSGRLRHPTGRVETRDRSRLDPNYVGQVVEFGRRRLDRLRRGRGGFESRTLHDRRTGTRTQGDGRRPKFDSSQRGDLDAEEQVASSCVAQVRLAL